jgi:Ca-activated chloride channel family protein
MLLPAVLLASLLQAQPLALRVEIAPLGRGGQGTVVGVALQVAPEDRERAGTRVRVEVTLLRDKRVVETGTAVIELADDGSGLLYREWPAGEGEARVVLESLDGLLRGLWQGPVSVPVEDKPFEVPEGAPADAIALGAAPADPGSGVRFMPPPRGGGIGALQLEVQAPPSTAKVEFFQDEQPLVARRRPPWTVSVPLGEVARRTTVRAVAYAADGRFLGEDALVLNGPAGQLAVAILLGPEPKPGETARTVTVSVGGARDLEEVTLRADEAVVGQWRSCPCAVAVPVDRLAAAKVLSAEARGPRGLRGEAVQLLGGEGFVGEIRVEQVELPVVVTDSAGRLITDLAASDFRVLEDGVEVPIDSFATTADLPLSLGLVVDASGSMVQPFPEVRRAEGGFLSSVPRPDDSLFLLVFSFDAKVMVDWTRNPEAIKAFLERVEPSGGTSLNDAVVRSLEHFRGRRGRTAVVLLSDGDDTTSRTGWETARRFLRTARVPVFTIGFRISKLDFFVRERLSDLAEDTGGAVYYASGGESLAEVYRAIGEQLRAQFLISYKSPSSKPAQEFRTVKVEVKRAGLTARTIVGYYPSQ